MICSNLREVGRMQIRVSCELSQKRSVVAGFCCNGAES
jgi:hypothetical protein